MGARLKRIFRYVPGARATRGLVRRAWAWGTVTREFLRFRESSRRQRPALVPLWRDRQLFLDNRTPQTPFDRHYVYHTAWAVRRLAEHRPHQHIDVSSSIYFAALGSAIVPMRHIDFRPPSLSLDGLEVGAGDLMALPLADNSVASLSCMHVVEHVGLGRYGDPLDPVGDVKAAHELARVLAPGGRFYFVVPVGRSRVCFNGHRVYNFQTVRSLFPGLELDEWALVPDDPSAGLLRNAAPELVDAQQYGCGCFAFRKAS